MRAQEEKNVCAILFFLTQFVLFLYYCILLVCTCGDGRLDSDRSWWCETHFNVKPQQTWSLFSDDVKTTWMQRQSVVELRQDALVTSAESGMTNDQSVKLLVKKT